MERRILEDRNGRIRILECDKDYVRDPKKRNNWIAESQQEYLGIAILPLINCCGMFEFINVNMSLSEYPVVLFAEGIPDGEADLSTFLSFPNIHIFGYIFKRKLLATSGKYNELLSESLDYEFLCRIAGIQPVFCISCDFPNGMDEGVLESEGELQAYTYAYIVRRYWDKLQDYQISDRILQGFIEQTQIKGCLQSFYNFFDKFFKDKSLYDRVASNTSPFLIFVGSDSCYGVLADFAYRLGDGLKSDGQAVVMTQIYMEYKHAMDWILKERWRGIIGFQLIFLEMPWMREVRGNKYQFLFDNPCIYLQDRVKMVEDNHYLCQDATYAAQLLDYYNAAHAIHFPPAGIDIGIDKDRIHHDNRCLDVVFIGTYSLPKIYEGWSERECAFYDYMMQHPSFTFEEGLQEFLGIKAGEMDKDEFLKLLWGIRPICLEVVHKYREQIVETILQSGIKLHVYGESWRNFQSEFGSNLVIHPELSVGESLKVLGNSKIGLNIMTWHKAGMTERIANIMLSGAVCVSDESIYLKQHFREDEEMVLFSLENLKELPIKIKNLLENEQERKKIAVAGYHKAVKEHTWKVRTQQFLKYVDTVELCL